MRLVSGDWEVDEIQITDPFAPYLVWRVRWLGIWQGDVHNVTELAALPNCPDLSTFTILAEAAR